VLKLGGVRSTNVTIADDRVFEPLERLEELDLRGSSPLAKTIFQAPESRHDVRSRPTTVLPNTTASTTSPVALGDLSNVRTLDLSNAGLTRLRPDFFSAMHNVESVDLRRNPWDCEEGQGLADFVGWLAKVAKAIVQPMSVKCATPVLVSWTSLTTNSNYSYRPR
jgi:hypothetical protein